MNIGIIGAGTMGSGIAQCFLEHGHNVILVDMTAELAERGYTRIGQATSKNAIKGKYTEQEQQKMMGCLKATAEYSCLCECELMVEASFEDMKVKKDIFQKVEEIVGETCILASNTSSFSITEIASVLKNKNRMIGMHFFNPVTAMKLIEVIRGAATSEQVLEKIITISKEIGKEPVILNESPGFIVNRLLVPMINEAAGVYAENIAKAEDIDKAMMLGCNFPIGPLALADLIGIDIVMNVMLTLQNEFGDDKYRVHPIIKKFVRAGRLGKKTGQGFYDYQ